MAKAKPEPTVDAAPDDVEIVEFGPDERADRRARRRAAIDAQRPAE